MASNIVYDVTVKGKRYVVQEYNWARNEYDLSVDKKMVLDSKPKDQCIEKILEMVSDEA